METGNQPHPITPKGLRVAKDAKGNLFLILDKKAIEGECEEVGTEAKGSPHEQNLLNFLTRLDCRLDIKIRTKCPDRSILEPSEES